LRAFLLIPFALAWFALSPHVHAICQEGCLTNNNTVLGDDALLNNTGTDNTAIGFNALYSNTSGYSNTAVGDQALFSNTNGPSNTAIGATALLNNNGTANTAIGANALVSNTTGNDNTATGSDALLSNRTGQLNTAYGAEALRSSATGRLNTAVGANALFNNSAGNGNIALGINAGLSLTTGSNNIEIGNQGVPGEDSTIRIGNYRTQTATYIAGISGAAVGNGVGVIVDTFGHLGTVVSSERFKDNIKAMDKASEAILALKPVTFRYKKEIDPDGIPQFGLVAEEVARVNPDLVVRDEKGEVYTVRYEAVNAMLLNEFLKEHRTVQQQQKEIDALKAELKGQRAFIQTMNDKVELHKSAPQTVSKRSVALPRLSGHLSLKSPLSAPE